MRAFLDLETGSFLPMLLDTAKDKDTPLFMQADFITAFFGRISYRLAEEVAPGYSPPGSPNKSWHTGISNWERS